MAAQVEARLRPSTERTAGEVPAGARHCASSCTRWCGSWASRRRWSATDNGDAVRANISGDDLGLLIGRHGATIDALQYIAAIVVTAIAVNGAR